MPSIIDNLFSFYKYFFNISSKNRQKYAYLFSLNKVLFRPVDIFRLLDTFWANCVYIQDDLADGFNFIKNVFDNLSNMKPELDPLHKQTHFKGLLVRYTMSSMCVSLMNAFVVTRVFESVFALSHGQLEAK